MEFSAVFSTALSTVVSLGADSTLLFACATFFAFALAIAAATAAFFGSNTVEFSAVFSTALSTVVSLGADSTLLLACASFFALARANAAATAAFLTSVAEFVVAFSLLSICASAC